MVAGALLVGLFAASVGAGYSMTKPELSNAQAVVQRGDTPVLVNTETERVEVEARALATGEQILELVTLADGRVASVNSSTNQVVLLGEDFGNPAEVTPSSTVPRQHTEMPVVVPSASAAFVLFPDSDVVEQIRDDNTTGSPVQVPGATEFAVGDGAGGLWLLTEDGKVVHVTGNRIARTISAPTPIKHLTLADGRPIGITTAGEALDIAATPLKSISREPVPSGSSVVVPSTKGSGRYLVLLDRTGKLVSIDPRTGQRREFDDLPSGAGHDLGVPVLLDDVVYVPDYQTHELIPRDLLSGEKKAPVAVPGKSPRFVVDVQDRRVVANDPKDRGTLAITPDGRPAVIDKGKGSGVVTDTDRIEPPGTLSSESKPTTTPSSPTNIPLPPSSKQTATSAPPVPEVLVPLIPPGTRRDEACDLVRAAELQCQALDIGVGGETGTVRDTSPRGGARVPEDSTVTVHVYGDNTKVPKVVGRNKKNACETVNTVLAPAGSNVCDEQAMPTAAANWGMLGVVAEQSPSDGDFVTHATRVTVRYWDFVTMPDLVSVAQDGASICNTIIADTGGQVKCTTTQGAEGAEGAVQASSPASGEPVRAGQTVVLTVFRQAAPPTSVPDVRNMTQDAACATVQTAGFVCDARSDSLARDRVVVTQEPEAGTLQKGGTVVIHYSPYQAAPLYLYTRDDNNNVNIVRFAPEPKYDHKPGVLLGYAYRVGDIPDGGVAGVFHDYMCNTSPTACGYKPNHYFSRDTTPKAGWEHERAVGLVLNAPGDQCTLPGQHVISRYRTDEFTYTVSQTPPPSWNYQEVLGCVWR